MTDSPPYISEYRLGEFGQAIRAHDSVVQRHNVHIFPWSVVERKVPLQVQIRVRLGKTPSNRRTGGEECWSQPHQIGEKQLELEDSEDEEKYKNIKDPVADALLPSNLLLLSSVK